MNSRPCAGCGRTIYWAKTQAGKAVPLEKINSVAVGLDDVATEAGPVLVNHFKTCPKADQFSSRIRG